MNELLNLIENFMKGVRRTMRTLIILIVLFFVAMSAGWIKIVCNGDKVIDDTVKPIKGLWGDNPQSGDSRKEYNITKESLKNKNYQIVQHVLQKGETLYDLHKHYGTDWRVIKKANKIIDVRLLRPGQVIFVPVNVKLSKLF